MGKLFAIGYRKCFAKSVQMANILLIFSISNGKHFFPLTNVYIFPFRDRDVLLLPTLQY